MPQLTIDTGAVRLAGDVWLPDAEPRCGVVLVGGSGETERTNDGYLVTYRDAFLAAGTAVLWYDKRGVGGSGGSLFGSTPGELAADASAAVRTLAEHVGGAPVGLFGHSEGGWVALGAAAAQSRGSASFVVTNSCPGVTPAEQDRYALACALDSDGAGDGVREHTLRLYDELLVAADLDADWDRAGDLIALSTEGATLLHHLGALDRDRWRFWARTRRHDPIADATRLGCEHLAVFGAADEMVPVQPSVTAFTAAACDPGRDPAAVTTVRIVPGADHRLLRPGATAPDPEHLAAVGRWILHAADAASRSSSVPSSSAPLPSAPG